MPTRRVAALIGSSIGKIDKSDALADGDILIYNATTTKWETKQMSAIASFVEAAQDAVGAMMVDSSEIDFTYTDATPALTGVLINGSVAYARIANASSLSVLGRSANTSGVLADIQAGTDGNVLRRSGAVIGFGSLDLTAAGTVGTSRLAFANHAQITGQAVLGVASAGAADLAAISAGTNDRVFRQTGGTLNFGQLTAGMFPSSLAPATDFDITGTIRLSNANSQVRLLATGAVDPNDTIYLDKSGDIFRFMHLDNSSSTFRNILTYRFLTDVLEAGASGVNLASFDIFAAQVTTSAKLIAGAAIRTKGYTVATLPAGTLGDVAHVTDALAPAFLAIAVGGGTVKTLVFHDGTNWVAN